MKYSLYSIVSVLFLFSSCKKTEIEQPQKDESLKFVKTWFDTVRMIPMSERLEIKQNKTFKYVLGACTSGSWSEGNWNLKNDTIILNSFKPKECIYLSDYGALCSTIEEMRKYPPESSIKNCKPNSEDSYEMFVNEKFYIKNDTLVHVKQNKKCEGFDFAYSSREKVR
ncbi:hypothetical protein [Flavobacterium koreense]